MHQKLSSFLPTPEPPSSAGPLTPQGPIYPPGKGLHTPGHPSILQLPPPSGAPSIFLGPPPSSRAPSSFQAFLGLLDWALCPPQTHVNPPGPLQSSKFPSEALCPCSSCGFRRDGRWSGQARKGPLGCEGVGKLPGISPTHSASRSLLGT